MQPAHIQALALAAILDGSDTAVEEMFCDTLMQFTAIRVGHIAPKHTKWMKHVLTWDNLYFYPSADNCEAVFYHVPTTKTRRGTELRPFWTCHGRVTSNPTVCPVTWAVRHWKRNFHHGVTSPSAPVFTSPTGKALARTVYTARLRLRLATAVSLFLNQPGFNVNSYSGISYRRGGITQLSFQAAKNRLNMDAVADFADHRDIKTIRGYNEQNIQSRSRYTAMMAEQYNSAASLLS
eukprot:SAG31_NODE_631_length_13367_cov_6.190648_1_plen_236_part_00